MTPSEQARAHDENFVRTFELIARHIPGGFVERVSGVPMASCAVPVPFFNCAWPLASAPPEAVGQVAARFRAAGVPFVIHVPPEAEELARRAVQEGLTLAGRLPCFAIEPGPIPESPNDLVIERVNEDNRAAFLEATATGFEMPPDMVRVLYPPSMTHDPAVRAFVGTLDGAPVATSLSVRTDATIGIYSVATAPAARGRGVGTAMTWHLMRDADPGWRLAVLQASGQGRPVYERMGFNLVRELDEYVSSRDA